MTDHTATYSPEDNKLRMYPAYRLDAIEYARMKATGFSWAPKQELFVAPMWTPERADLLEELCGEIGDEDTSLVDRAEERAERFEDYSERRLSDAERAHDHVKTLADGIPLGQPILIGHHSERRARRDAEKIENGMRKAVKMWETSKYWEQRARGALRHAKYKERPDVRARRIKGLEADARKQERRKAEVQRKMKLWGLVDQPEKWEARADGTFPTREERARFIAGNTDSSFAVCRENADGTPKGAAWEFWSAYDVLKPDGERYSRCPSRTVDEVLAALAPWAESICAHADRWLNHYNNRLAYERAMLAESGGTIADRTKPEIGGACRCWASPRGGWSYIQKVNKVSVAVLDNWGNGGGNFKRTIQLSDIKGVMTAAQVSEARTQGRVREDGSGIGFWLADPSPSENPTPPPTKAPEPTPFDAMKDTLKSGVQVVTAPHLFPTPPDLAARMVELADIEPGNRVLEPSAGTGRLIEAMRAPHIREGRGCGAVLTAVEINPRLAGALSTCLHVDDVRNADFLSLNGDLGTFDRVLMNPPFENGSDIRHIRHAFGYLKPGGRLVALCANGPRQRDALQPLSSHWEDLPAGTFAAQGTNVNVALLVMERGAE